MNKLLTIDGYTLRAHIKHITHPSDHFWFEIASQYDKSRWPDDERKPFGVLLSRTQLSKLGSIINLALAYQKPKDAQ